MSSGSDKTNSSTGLAEQLFTGKAGYWSTKYDTDGPLMERLRLFLSAVDSCFPANARVLEFGCGPGVLATEMASRGHSVTGIDISDQMISNAQTLATERNVTVELRTGDVTSLQSLDSGSFDGVVASSVFEYLPDADEAIQSFVALLKPGGHFVLTVPNKVCYIRRLERIGAVVLGALSWCPLPGRVKAYHDYLKVSRNRYSEKQFVRYAAAAHLKLQRCEYMRLEKPNPSKLKALTSPMLFFVFRKQESNA